MATAREMADRNFAAWRARDAEAFSGLYAEEAIIVAPGMPQGQGPEAARALLDGWYAAFPDNEIEVHTEHHTDRSAVIEGTFSGTHTGELHTPDGQTIPPTGRRISARFAEVLVVEDDEIVGDRLYFDQLEMLAQLGLMGDPAVAAH